MIRKPITQHFIFWILYFSFNVARWGFFYDDFEYSFISNLVEFIIHISLVYINIYYFLPRLFPKKIMIYVLAISLLVCLFSVFKILLTYQFVTTEVYKELNIPGLDLFDPNYFIAVFIGEFYVVGFTTAIKLGMDYISSLKKTKELESEKMEAELSFLRSQIQPHFFFNTLNNLYSLTLHKSNKAPETILKLSDLMSYVIYKGKSKRVELLNEVKHINDFLDLEKLRYGKKLNVQIEISGSLEGYFVPPLVLTPFVENCFKHGNIRDSEIPIFIEVKVENNRLSYKVENKVSKEKNQPVERKGVGLKNVKRRLNILYPNNHGLSLEQNVDVFTSLLNIPLYDKLSNN